MVAPAMPERAPDRNMTAVKRKATFIPAYWLAVGEEPAARNSNPMVDLNNSQWTKNTAPIARNRPMFTRYCCPNMGGSLAESRIGADCGKLDPSAWKTAVLSAHNTKNAATKLSMIVVI